VDFTHRSYKKELLDGTHIPFADIKRNMEELDTINHLLGGHKITLRGIKKIIASTENKPARWRIAEVGCGGGDNLSVIKGWAARQGIEVQLTGVDINPECINFACSKPQNAGIHFICAD
jgi:2-polyprenyl-3-methyl-5-hydroxy-6-metoxy-1,4-benzoquinol methylase